MATGISNAYNTLNVTVYIYNSHPNRTHTEHFLEMWLVI